MPSPSALPAHYEKKHSTPRLNVHQPQTDSTIVSVAACNVYELDALRRSLTDILLPLGGMERFVRPSMRVLLKPNLLSVASIDKAITTHPAMIQAVAELVKEAGASVLIGDSPAGPTENGPRAWRKIGLTDVAERTGAELVHFDDVAWKQLNGHDYFIARPVCEVDLIINLPKLKTHLLTLYTGSVKNLFGVIPGTRKRQVHVRAPGVQEFSRALVDVLELVKPGLTILDGIIGQEGYGPGARGTPHRYGCVAASSDPVALDTVITQAMGCRPGQVLHLAIAAERKLGEADLHKIQVEGAERALDFGRVRLPVTHRYLRLPAWMGAPAQRAARLRPHLDITACIGCAQCVEVCPREAITPGRPPQFDLERCIGCMCCAEICPQAAIEPQRSLLARWLNLGY